jgi:hypothetical protein
MSSKNVMEGWDHELRQNVMLIVGADDFNVSLGDPGLFGL